MSAVRRLQVAILAMVAATAAAAAAPCEPFVEVHAEWASASLRPHRTALERCVIDEATYRTALRAWLASPAAESGALESLALGRAVDYPWISRHIADAALRIDGWPARAAAARRGEFDRLGAQAIRDPALLSRLAEPFEGSRYRVIGLSFEKILFGPAGVHASAPARGEVPVPFDAQLWLRLAPRL